MSKPKHSTEITVVAGSPLAEVHDEPLLTKDEAAEALGVCLTIFQKRFQPLLAGRRVGKRLKFREADVLELRDRATEHRSAADAAPLATAIPAETYGLMIDDLQAGMPIVAVACKHGVYLPEAEKLLHDYLLLRKAVLLDNPALTSLWASASTLFGRSRPSVDSEYAMTKLFDDLVFVIPDEDAQRGCRLCPQMDQRRATLCDVCAYERYHRKSRRR